LDRIIQPAALRLILQHREIRFGRVLQASRCRG
jgi:hypothetical protein